MDNRLKTYTALADQGLISGVNFATGLILARFLGMEGYGEYVLAYGAILFIASIQMSLIISPMMTTAPSLPKDEHSAYYPAMLVIQLGYNTIMTIVVLLACLALNLIKPDWELEQLQWPLSFALFAFLLQDFLRRFFFVRNEAAKALICDSISYGFQIITLIIYVIYYDLTAVAALWILGITSIAATIYGLYSYTSHSTKIPAFSKYIHEQINHSWHVGKWLIGGTIAYWSGSQFIIYLTAFLLSAKAVGAMAAARNIVGIANILFAALENILPSRAAIVFNRHGDNGLNRYLLRVAIIGGFLTFGIALIASIAPELWLNIVYGNEYKGYGWLVIAWAVYFFIGFFHRPLAAGLRAKDQTKSILHANAIGAIVVLTLSYFVILYSQILGAMFMLIANQTVILILLAHQLRKAEQST
jgi:O-antigen/teichoic acid export membrane protein